MDPRALDCLACPVCETPLPSTAEADSSAQLRCESGHSFCIEQGVPRLRPEDASPTDAKGDSSGALSASFSTEWEHFDDEASRTWHSTVEERGVLFPREMDVSPEALRGKIVLDARCGNGTLSEGIARFGCNVLALDVSERVFAAHHYFAENGCGRAHFIRGSLLNLPVRHKSVDFIYSSGVLHHNPSTLDALRAIIPALKPGGKVYIWVYQREPGMKFRLQLALRRVVAPLPMPLKRTFIYCWSLQSMSRQHLRTLLGLNDAEDRLSWKERVVDLMDIYTPRYRWMHTQDELHRWYRDLGLSDVKTTEVRKWGFGVVGTAPS